MGAAAKKLGGHMRAGTCGRAHARQLWLVLGGRSGKCHTCCDGKRKKCALFDGSVRVEIRRQDVGISRLLVSELASGQENRPVVGLTDATQM
jgi:hypothetical protein